MPEFTDAQVVAAIGKAMAAGNIRAAVDLLHVLAAQNPSEAQLILDVIDLQSRKDKIQ
jgi:hypothetical protein